MDGDEAQRGRRHLRLCDLFRHSRPAVWRVPEFFVQPGHQVLLYLRTPSALLRRNIQGIETCRRNGAPNYRAN